MKQDLEKENRKLHVEINDLQEKLALAEQRVSQLYAVLCISIVPCVCVRVCGWVGARACVRVCVRTLGVI